jgi:hypothetical protein
MLVLFLTYWNLFLNCVYSELESGVNVFSFWHSGDRTPSCIHILKANKMHCFSNLFDKVLCMFRTSPLSIIRSISTLYTCNRYLSCCTVLRYSWWWTVDLSETCRVLYQINLRNSASRWLSVYEYSVLSYLCLLCLCQLCVLLCTVRITVKLFIIPIVCSVCYERL